MVARDIHVPIKRYDADGAWRHVASVLDERF